MVANFAMSVLNGVGGAKLEKIIPVNTNFSFNNPVTYNLGKVFKYILLEVNYITDYSGVVSYLGLGSQFFFLNESSDDKYVISAGSNDSNKIITSSYVTFRAFITNNTITISGKIKGDKLTIIGNIYCFN